MPFSLQYYFHRKKKWSISLIEETGEASATTIYVDFSGPFRPKDVVHNISVECAKHLSGS